jgi:indole-3-glycerol phosphate synthase
VGSIAKAALAGASGVALPAEQLSEETLAELIHACYALDMEPFVEVSRADRAWASLLAILILLLHLHLFQAMMSTNSGWSP